jgi:hypothetical protein
LRNREIRFILFLLSFSQPQSRSLVPMDDLVLQKFIAQENDPRTRAFLEALQSSFDTSNPDVSPIIVNDDEKPSTKANAATSSPNESASVDDGSTARRVARYHSEVDATLKIFLFGRVTAKLLSSSASLVAAASAAHALVKRVNLHDISSIGMDSKWLTERGSLEAFPEDRPYPNNVVGRFFNLEDQFMRLYPPGLVVALHPNRFMIGVIWFETLRPPSSDAPDLEVGRDAFPSDLAADYETYDSDRLSPTETTAVAPTAAAAAADAARQQTPNKAEAAYPSAPADASAAAPPTAAEGAAAAAAASAAAPPTAAEGAAAAAAASAAAPPTAAEGAAAAASAAAPPTTAEGAAAAAATKTAAISTEVPPHWNVHWLASPWFRRQLYDGCFEDGPWQFQRFSDICTMAGADAKPLFSGAPDAKAKPSSSDAPDCKKVGDHAVQMKVMDADKSFTIATSHETFRKVPEVMAFFTGSKLLPAVASSGRPLSHSFPLPHHRLSTSELALANALWTEFAYPTLLPPDNTGAQKGRPVIKRPAAVLARLLPVPDDQK